MNNKINEQTLSIIKPDATERNLEGEIKKFFENNNLKIIKSKKVKILVVFILYIFSFKIECLVFHKEFFQLYYWHSEGL